MHHSRRRHPSWSPVRKTPTHQICSCRALGTTYPYPHAPVGSPRGGCRARRRERCRMQNRSVAPTSAGFHHRFRHRAVRCGLRRRSAPTQGERLECSVQRDDAGEMVDPKVRARGRPHSPQNAEPSGFSCLHAAQIMTTKPPPHARIQGPPQTRVRWGAARCVACAPTGRS